MSILVTLPVIVPLAAFALTLACWRAPKLRGWAVAAGALASLGVAIALIAEVSREGALAIHVGAWPAGFAIALAADRLSALMVLLAAIIGAATLLFAKDEPGAESRSPAFGPAAFLLLAGVNGAFVTADLFNLYVWFEVMLMGSFALLAIGGGARRTEGALKYVTLNLLSSAIFLAAAGAIYAAARSLSLAELSLRMPTIAAENPALAASFAVLLLVAFGIKAGLFPLFFWLPSSYHTAPFAVSALFAGLLTKVGVYAMLRVLPLVFEGLSAPFELLLALAAFTMLAGVLGAISQGAIRRILGFHIVSQIGY
ncbi:MAG: proton-conducting transporter membrane subunit, partial [Pseudomonadales bacterium]|nr:proton-conducting transporter membrane subunit [Pseudomonadales bacterium]